MAQDVAKASVLVIEELPADGKLGRRLELVGGALPKKMAQWPISQRLETTWYVGNSIEATQQVLGPVDLPSTWEFAWHRTMLSRKTPIFVDERDTRTKIVNPHILYFTLEDIIRGGLRLRVTWSTYLAESDPTAPKGEIKIVREGRASKMTPSIATAEDIECSITFDWVGRGGQQQRAQSVRDGGIEAASVAFQSALSAYTLKEAAIRGKVPNVKPISTFTLGQLARIANGPLDLLASVGRQFQQASNNIADLVLTARQIALTPQALAASALAIAQNTLAIANQTKYTLQQQPPEVVSLNQRSSDVARAARHIGEMDDALTEVARRAQDMIVQALKISAPIAKRDARGALVNGQSNVPIDPAQVQRIYVVHSGDTPASISRKEYGTPDFASAILKANRLPWHQVALDPGTALIIPVDPQTLN